MDIRDEFPLTRRHLGELAPAASREALVGSVCAQHARGDIPSRGVRDLVRYEALVAEAPRAETKPTAPPRDDERVIIAPHVRVLVYGAALPEMLAALRAGKPAKPRPARGWLVLWRGGELVLPRMEGWLLESFREATLVSEAVEDDEDRARFLHLWNAGILTRA